MNETAISFNDLPIVVAEINRKLDRLLSIKEDHQQTLDEDRLLTVEELQDFLPEHPARQTVYGWVNYRLIPYEKHGKRLYFRKSRIESWLSSGRQLGPH